MADSASENLYLTKCNCKLKFRQCDAEKQRLSGNVCRIRELNDYSSPYVVLGAGSHNLSTQSITSCGVVRVEAHTTPYYSSSPYFSLKVVGVLVVVVVPYVVVVVAW